MTTLRLDNRTVFGTDGSGNQKKIWIDDTLIKLNSKHREASKEESASILGKAFGLDVVEYKKMEYLIEGKKCIGCECKTFLQENEIAIPAIDIINFYNIDIPQKMSALEYFNITVDCICRYTGISKGIVEEYILQMLVFDFIICNPDRHLSNFELVYDEVTPLWRPAPLFDHGQGFLCRDGGLTNQQIEQAIHKLKMRPFSSNQFKNLIDIGTAKSIAKRFLDHANDMYNSFDQIPMNEFHKKIARMQIQRLLSR